LIELPRYYEVLDHCLVCGRKLTEENPMCINKNHDKKIVTKESDRNERKKE
jgi:predicted nucleic acid-binding Zn ribbon protein